MTQKLQNAQNLYMEGIRDGNSKEALDKYTGHRYTQHSSGVADGKEGFLEFFLPFVERTPDRDIRVVRAIEDGPNVFCHVYQSLNGGEAKWVTMDIFDTDDQDRIIEHWDVIAAYEDTVSGEDMVGGPTEPTDLDKTDANKALVNEYVKLVLTEGRHEMINQFVAGDMIQHSPKIAAGSAGMASALADDAIGGCDILAILMGQGDMVATLTKMYRTGKEHAVINLYRVSGGKIAEMWECAEEILPRDQWGNSGKF